MTPGPRDENGLAADRAGAGPPVVLIHGLGGPASWERVVPLLARDRDVLVPHLPGFGRTPPDRAASTPQAHAVAVADLLDRLGVRPATVAGVSLGGEVAAMLAAARPDLVSGLVLVAPTGTASAPVPLRARAGRAVARALLRRALGRRTVADFLSRRSFHDPSRRPPGLLERHLDHLRRPGRLDALADAAVGVLSGGATLPGSLGAVQAPVRLVWGREDRSVPVRGAAAITAVRPEIAPTILPGCGHSVPLERPAELAGVIRDALRPYPP